MEYEETDRDEANLTAGIIVDSSDGMSRDMPEFYSFDMALPIRMDIAAGLAYSLGLLGSLFLLFGEHKNDLVRFHAWQSFLVFFSMLLVQLMAGMIAPGIQNLIIIFSILFGFYLGWIAFKLSASLQVFYLPIIGDWAATWTLNE